MPSAVTTTAPLASNAVSINILQPYGYDRRGIDFLLPSILAALILLFGNAFGAYATAYALTGGLINIVPILIGAQIRGNVLHDPQLGYALAFGMVIVMTVSILFYSWLQKISSRWVK